MNVRLCLLVLVLAALLLPVLNIGQCHATPIEQKRRAAPQKRAAQIHYTCPMHSEVQSKSRGTCPKCKMSLVKKRGPRTTTALTRHFGCNIRLISVNLLLQKENLTKG
jgi:hypothetical protein